MFASILDWRKGGHFSISPVDDAVNRKQLYWPDTNVLLTRFLSADGVAEVLDYMPVGVLRRRHEAVPRCHTASACRAWIDETSYGVLSGIQLCSRPARNAPG